MPQPTNKVPARIILSRKGWDSKAGGSPSPILPDGYPLSLPIPDQESGVRYADLYLPGGRKLIGEMVAQLSNGRIKPDDHVHLDPDIRHDALKRTSFRAAFGQCGGAQTHLWNQRVCHHGEGKNNDLFLFFGRFREVEECKGEWRYRRGARDLQVIFGWLQVGEIIPLNGNFPEWAKSHPHCVPSGLVRAELNKHKTNNNTLYTAASSLSFCSKPGAGVFRHVDTQNSDIKCFTAAEGKASIWRLPKFFKNEQLSSLSNMGTKAAWILKGNSWIVQRKGPGQEFVLDTKGREQEVLVWLTSLFAAA